MRKPDDRYRTCGSNISGRATLVRQLSDTRCTENVSFGVRNGQLWVDRGCRGVFQVRTGHWGGNGGSDYSVTCSSTNNRYTTCAWDARRGPRLISQLSTTAAAKAIRGATTSGPACGSTRAAARAACAEVSAGRGTARPVSLATPAWPS